MTKLKTLKETHPSLVDFIEITTIKEPYKLRNPKDKIKFKIVRMPYELFQKHTRDVAKIREVFLENIKTFEVVGNRNSANVLRGMMEDLNLEVEK